MREQSGAGPLRIRLATPGEEEQISGAIIRCERADAETILVRIHTPYTGAYGLGEKFDAINQKGKTVRNVVIEKFCNQGDLTYCSIPFFFTDTGIGVLADTKRETIFRFEESIALELPLGTDLLFFTGSPVEILQQLITQMGGASMPPRWVFGPWISANHWDSQEKVETVQQEIHEYGFPATVLVLEAWSDEATFYIWNGAIHEPKADGELFRYEDFTFPEDGPWPDPKEMVASLKEEGIHTVLWQIPAYRAMEEIPGEGEAAKCATRQNELDAENAIRKNLVVKHIDGTPYRIPEGNWFAGSLIPDFSNPETRKSWLAHRQYLLDMGIDGFKTDGGEFIYDNDLIFHNGDTNLEQKNAYCQSYIRAYHDFLGEGRVLFSRAGHTGAQHTPILWAGDHQSTFSELRGAYTAGMTAACSGISYWSFDIGGFAGGLPSPELYLRSTQFACFCPVMQWHSEPDGGQFAELMPGMSGNNERSPWNIANQLPEAEREEYLREIRFWHNLRMLLMPYICSEAAKSSRDHLPMMRPIFLDSGNAADSELLLHDDEYFFGESLLIAPILTEGAETREVYLPEGTWTGLFSGRIYEGRQTIRSEERYPVYLRGGKAAVLTGRIEEAERVVSNRTEGLTELLLLAAGESGAYEFVDERGGEMLRWSGEKLMKSVDSRIAELFLLN